MCEKDGFIKSCPLKMTSSESTYLDGNYYCVNTFLARLPGEVPLNLIAKNKIFSNFINEKYGIEVYFDGYEHVISFNRHI